MGQGLQRYFAILLVVNWREAAIPEQTKDWRSSMDHKGFPNRLRQLLAEDRPLLGTFVNFPDPALVEFSGMAGFDWVMLDGEHEGTGIERCYELVRAANTVGLASVVRVPANRAEIVLAYAETGVDAILCPHVDSRSTAEAFVQSLHYWPRGM